jgi:membrane protein implicated in regulation of membrane protease activity
MHPALMWMIAGLALLIVELMAGSFFLMWIGAGALLTALLAVFVRVAWVQWLFFALASLVLLLATRPLARKLHGGVTLPSNVDSLKGMEGQVLEEINFRLNTGRVRVRSDEWRARSAEVIAPGTHVVIDGIEGTTLQVRPADTQSEPEV